jgi:hypothetical protein
MFICNLLTFTKAMQVTLMQCLEAMLGSNAGHPYAMLAMNGM